jgi:hypothetical protein
VVKKVNVSIAIKGHSKKNKKVSFSMSDRGRGQKVNVGIAGRGRGQKVSLSMAGKGRGQ